MTMTRDPNAPATSGEQHESPKMGTAVISGATFRNKSVTYYEAHGVAMVEGDIALGSIEAVKSATQAARDALAQGGAIAFGVGITGSQFRWPNCQIPYEIDANLPNQQRVTDAIAHWEANTPFRFPLRTAANAAQYPNYVRFTDAGGCWSMVGMQGGQQTISLGAACTTGNAIHEIGHAVGLWHEQSREDRDLFVTINWQNIQAGMAAQFNQHITDGDDWGSYDYGSIMHYPRTAFSANGQETITPTDPNAQIGQRNGLSAGDIAAVRGMYPGCGVGPKPVWRDVNFKKFRDDNRFKKIFDDGTIIKQLRDPKLPRDPGPIKMGLDPMPIGRPVVGVLGGLEPFSLATPHHATVSVASPCGHAHGGDADEGRTAEYLEALQRQILELDALIAQARATAAQANADAAKLEGAAQAVHGAYEAAMRDIQMPASR